MSARTMRVGDRRVGHVVRRGAAILFAVGAVVLAAVGDGTGGTYPALEPVDLGTLGGTTGVATAVNAAGQIAGSSATASGQTHAFLWTPTGGMTDLGTLGGTTSAATAIGENGQVVGTSTVASGETHAFSWTAAGGMRDLGVGRAVAINASGEVACAAARLGAPSVGFVWSEADGKRSLGTFGGTTSVPADISDHGQVVGYSTTANGDQHAFLWTDADGLVDLRPSGGALGANGINEAGEVVGGGVLGHAFSWTAAGGFVDRGTLPGSFGQVPTGRAESVNEFGQFVGTTTVDNAPLIAVEATLWTAAGAIAPLPFAYANGINASGEVIGADADEHGSEIPPRSLAWTPSAGPVLLGGLGGVIAFGSAEALDLNDKGTIVGGSPTPANNMHPTLWRTPTSLLVPQAATSPTATPGDGAATVGFQPPLVDAGAVSYYTVTSSPGGVSVSGTHSPITVDGLDNGTEYSFTVTAANAFGASAPSAASAPVVPAGGARVQDDPPPSAERPSVPDPPAAPRPRPPIPPR